MTLEIRSLKRADILGSFLLVLKPSSFYNRDMPSKERFVIIDGQALVHRAYYAIPPLTTIKGEQVNAVYGFTSMLLNVIRDLKPKYLAVAYDLPGPTKRHQEFKDYKANRQKKPDDLISQLERTKDVIKAFNIPLLVAPGYEADDVIGTVAKKLKSKKEIETIIVTGDLDELQLVDNSVKVFTMRRGFSDTVIYDAKKTKEKTGVLPHQIVDFKALKGDPSDNIPGVSGIGEKTAQKLIAEFGSLENIYKNIGKIDPKIAQKLSKEKDKAFLSQRLAQINSDIKLKFSVSKCLLSDFEKEKVIALFQELGFKSLFNRLPDQSSSPLKKSSPKIKTIGLEEVIKSAQKEKKIALSLFCDSESPIGQEPQKISLSNGKGIFVENWDNRIREKIKPIIEDNKITKVGHDLKRDYILLKNSGLKMTGPYFDTMIAAYLLDPRSKEISLSNLIVTELGKGSEALNDNIWKNALAIFKLSNLLKKKLAESSLLSLAEKIDFPLLEILAEMEILGIGLNKKKLEKLSKEISKEILQTEKKIYQIAKTKFNINSPAQLQEIIYQKLKLHQKISSPDDIQKLKSGGFSTSAQELEKLKDAHPIIPEIIKYRELTKLKSTYVDTLPGMINQQTKRLHTNFKQTLTQTGRLSSSEPNLQNIPTKNNLGKEIRKAFQAKRGMSFISADYSQIELRVIAHIADDKKMIKIFKENRDIHTETAMKLYNIKNKDLVTPRMRRAAKVVNFGILYGVSAHGLHQQIGIAREEAEKLIQRYFELYPHVKKYTEEIVAQARELGYVETIFGRRRYLPEINSKNFSIRKAAERMAINMPIQGTAADLIKLAMIDIYRELPLKFPQAKLILQIHDELILEAPKKEAAAVSILVKEKMNNVVELKVPIATETHIADTLGDLK